MFDSSPVLNEYVVLTLGVGVALVIGAALTHQMLWRPRMPQKEWPDRTWRGAWSFIPWILILTYVGMIVYGLLMAADKMLHPPNW